MHYVFGLIKQTQKTSLSLEFGNLVLVFQTKERRSLKRKKSRGKFPWKSLTYSIIY